MRLREKIGSFLHFLKQDTWQSWLVSFILIIIVIKLIIFPFLSLITGSSLPLVVVESCSMYHETEFNSWWGKYSPLYEQFNITKKDFSGFNFKSGLNKGDIILVINKLNYNKGDVIIFEAPTRYPIIHRLVNENPLSTKGDHNPGQLEIERDISKNNVIGKGSARIPYLGWVKLIFFDFLKPKEQRGFCR